MSSDLLVLPPGYGMRRLGLSELRERDDLMHLLHVYEPPRLRGERRYLIGVDAAGGLGQDRSVVEVVRDGTLHEPAEQVAEFVSDQVSPTELAYVIYAVGQWYQDDNKVPALVAIELTDHGLSTQSTLQLHLGYPYLYRWEYMNAADPSKRWSTVAGWKTTVATRPLMLDKLRTAVTTLDPISNLPDLVTHSPLLHQEFQDFQTNGALWEAEAARGAHDDCVMALAIAVAVMWNLRAGETEPLDDRRRRRVEQTARQAAVEAQPRVPDWRNTPTSTEEMGAWVGDEPEDLDEQLYDPVRGPEIRW